MAKPCHVMIVIYEFRKLRLFQQLLVVRVREIFEIARKVEIIKQGGCLFQYISCEVPFLVGRKHGSSKSKPCCKTQKALHANRNQCARAAHPTRLRTGALSVSVIICIVSACEENCYLLTLLLDADEQWPTLYSRDDYPEYYVDRQHPTASGFISRVCAPHYQDFIQSRS
jgi:hypothetical protein